MKIKNRIKELRYVKASEIAPNPKNWRTHPKEQADALRGVLAEVGMADAVLARELEDGTLMLIDGHMRAETFGDEPVAVLVLDVTEDEADKLLAVFDPIAAIAGVNKNSLEELLAGIDARIDLPVDTLQQRGRHRKLFLVKPTAKDVSEIENIARIDSFGPGNLFRRAPGLRLQYGLEIRFRREGSSRGWRR